MADLFSSFLISKQAGFLAPMVLMTLSDSKSRWNILMRDGVLVDSLKGSLNVKLSASGYASINNFNTGSVLVKR